MLISHEGRSPAVDKTAWVAPDATICGDVVLGPGSRVLHGARIVAEAGSAIRIGCECIVMENAVIRANPRHPCSIGDNCLVGPNVHLVGANVEEQVFIATGAAVFHGATIGRRSQVRINGIVHIKTRLPERSVVPIGWIAVGDPASILPTHEHDKIWAAQEPLNFPGWVYGIERDVADPMVKITQGLSKRLRPHASDRIL